MLQFYISLAIVSSNEVDVPYSIGVFAIFKRGQAFSVDLLLAVGIFLIMFIGLFVFLAYTNQPDTIGDIEAEAQHILQVVSTEQQEVLTDSTLEGITFVDKGRINEQDLKDLAGADYEEIKKLIGTQRNFCIFLEDESGDIIYLEFDDGTGAMKGKVGIGNSDVMIGGNRCGVPIP